MAVLAAVPALTFVIGDVALQRSSVQFSAAEPAAANASASTANELLRPWPDPATWLAKISILGMLNGRPGSQDLVIHWAEVAADRNPADPNLWYQLASYQLRANHRAAARRSALRALRAQPWFNGADNLLGDIAILSGDQAAADRYWRASLLVQPNQPTVRAELKGHCRPVSSKAGTSAWGCP
jgi:hypothetical protein